MYKNTVKKVEGKEEKTVDTDVCNRNGNRNGKKKDWWWPS